MSDKINEKVFDPPKRVRCVDPGGDELHLERDEEYLLTAEWTCDVTLSFMCSLHGSSVSYYRRRFVDVDEPVRDTAPMVPAAQPFPRINDEESTPFDFNSYNALTSLPGIRR